MRSALDIDHRVELTLLLGRIVVLVVVQAEGLLDVLDERARLGVEHIC